MGADGTPHPNVLRAPVQASRPVPDGGTLEVNRPGGGNTMRLFRRTSRKAAAALQLTPEFGVRVTLRKGDKIVRRDARGIIHVVQITEERVDMSHVQTARPARKHG